MRTVFAIAAAMAAVAVAVGLAGCGAETPAAPAPEAASAAPAPAGPARLPIGEITPADTPALMAAAYPDGVPDTVKDIGVFVLGERAGLLTGSDSAETCATCAGHFSLFYLARTEAGFLVQKAYPDFHTSGSKGRFNRDTKVIQLGGVDGGPAYAGFADINAAADAACSSTEVTVGIFTEAGPRIALKTPFGSPKVDASLVASAPYQADFAIEYLSATDAFVAPYLFVNEGLRPSFPAPAWTRGGC